MVKDSPSPEACENAHLVDTKIVIACWCRRGCTWGLGPAGSLEISEAAPNKSIGVMRLQELSRGEGLPVTCGMACSCEPSGEAPSEADGGVTCAETGFDLRKRLTMQRGGSGSHIALQELENRDDNQDGTAVPYATCKAKVLPKHPNAVKLSTWQKGKNSG